MAQGLSAGLLGNALIGKLMDVGLRDRVRIALRAGLDLSQLPQDDAQRNVPVNNAIARAFGNLDGDSRQRILPILADAIAAMETDHREDMMRLVHQHGYEYFNGSFIPVGLIDEREAHFVPPAARIDLSKAISRLATNDESGAITAACGALDGSATALYEKHRLGLPSAPF